MVEMQGRYSESGLRSCTGPRGGCSAESTKTIHSGHFMKSSLEDDEIDVNFADTGSQAVLVFSGSSSTNNLMQMQLLAQQKQQNPQELQNQGQQTQSLEQHSMQQVQALGQQQQQEQEQHNSVFSKRSSSVSIDESLSKLLAFLSLTYSGKLTSPKWNEFRGMRFTTKDKIRLNNIIWREYHLQFVKQKRPKVVQFASPLSDEVHSKAEAVIMEGKYWKRRLETVCSEYSRWRIFYKHRLERERAAAFMSTVSSVNEEPMDITTNSDWLAQNSVADLKRRSGRPGSPAANNSGAIGVVVGSGGNNLLDDILDLQLDLEGFLLPSDPLQFPTSKDFNQIGNSDFIQPGLLQLQPSIDDAASATDILALLTSQQQTPAAPVISSYQQQHANQPHQQQMFHQPQTAPATTGAHISLQSFIAPSPVSSSANQYHQQFPPTSYQLRQELPVSAGTSIAGQSRPVAYSFSQSPQLQQQPTSQQQQSLKHEQGPVSLMDLLHANPGRPQQQQPQQHQHQPQPMISLPNLPSSMVKIEPAIQMPQQQLNPVDQQKVVNAFQLLLKVPPPSPAVVNSMLQYLSSVGITLQHPELLLQQQQAATVIPKPPATTANCFIDLTSSSSLRQQQQPTPLAQPQTQPGSKPSVSIPPGVSPALYSILTGSSSSFSTVPQQQQQQQPSSIAVTPKMESTIASQSSLVPSLGGTIVMTAEQKIQSQSAVPQLKQSLSVRESSFQQQHQQQQQHRSLEHSEVYQLHRRHSVQVNPEQKRRFSINNGFDALHSLVPSLAANPHAKVSKAVLLHKAADHMQRLKTERANIERESEQLKQEIARLRRGIDECCERLPNTGAIGAAAGVSGVGGAAEERLAEARRWFEEAYVRPNVLNNWKFYVFSLIISDLFDAFSANVTTHAVDDFARSVLSWVDQHCSLIKLRTAVQRALTQFSTSTSILNDPQAAPSQVLAGVQARSMPLSIELPPSMLNHQQQLQHQNSGASDSNRNSSWPDFDNSDDEGDIMMD